MANPPKVSELDDDKTYSDEEIARRRDETLKRMLDTPPKPHDEMTGKGKAKKPIGKKKPAK